MKYVFNFAISYSSDSSDTDMLSIALLLDRYGGVPEDSNDCLARAVLFNKSDAVLRLLVGRGACLEGRWKSTNNTVLFYAVTRNRMATVKMLLDMGADLNAKNRARQTPLLYGLMHRCNLEIIMTLVLAGAELKDSGALHYASSFHPDALAVMHKGIDTLHKTRRCMKALGI